MLRSTPIGLGKAAFASASSRPFLASDTAVKSKKRARGYSRRKVSQSVPVVQPCAQLELGLTVLMIGFMNMHEYSSLHNVAARQWGQSPPMRPPQSGLSATTPAAMHHPGHPRTVR